jgi:2',3'-cyclic-nucleotide 2'-phosphodiesterase (5'-nucleotidase family)
VDGPIAAIAKGAAGVDGVFGGHSHTWVSGHVGGRPVIISSSNGRAFGVMRLDWDDVTKDVVAAEPAVASAFADSIAPDPVVAAVVTVYEEAIGPAMSRVVATAATSLERGSPEQPLGILIADVIRRAAGTDFAMQNPGGVRTEIAAGPITVAKVYELMPFDNLILKYSLSGGQVRRILEDGLAYGRAMQISGLRYSYDPGRPEGNRITSLVRDSGAPLDSTETYTLATNDFLAGGGDGMETLKSIADYTNTNELVRDEILAWLEEETAAGRPIVPPEPGRIKEEEAK